MREERLRHLVLGCLLNLADYWKVRRMPLVCPSCFERASEATFAQGRWAVRKDLHCDACGEMSDVSGWRLAASYKKGGPKLPSLSGN